MSKWVLFGNAFAVSDDNSGYLGQVGFKYNFRQALKLHPIALLLLQLSIIAFK
jgi:hypothetical protein